MSTPKLLSIVILSCERLDLLEKTVSSLIATIDYPLWEMVIHNQPRDLNSPFESQKKARLKLFDAVRGEYILNTEDDFLFTDNWEWTKLSIELLEKYSEVGIVVLRKNGDGFGSGNYKYIEEHKNFYFVECSESCFTFNPFIAKRETLEKLLKESNLLARHEKNLKHVYKRLGFKTIQLKCERNGVCVHIGKGRSLIGHDYGNKI